MSRFSLSRRKLLSIGVTAGSISVAGCAGGRFRDVPIIGTGNLDGEIGTDPTDTVPEFGDIIHFSELPEVEQETVRPAIERGVVRVCLTDDGNQADALRSFASRIETMSTYLEYVDDYYSLWVRIGEKTPAHSTGPPEADENPCG